MLRKTLTVIAIYLVSFSNAYATESNLSFDDAWARPAIGTMSAAYGIFKNSGNAPIEIIAAEAEGITHVELHETAKNDQGMMQMRKMERFIIPANGTIELKPGSYHIMFIGVEREIKGGDTLPVTFTLKNGDTLVSTIPVKELY